MLFEPCTDFKIVGEEEYPRRITEIENTLESCAQSGTLETAGGMSLSWRRFGVKDPKAAVVIVHGFTEFSRKYDELCWYFMNMGYDVYVYDQRGHGLSGREAGDGSLIHINSFDDYVDDLDVVIEQVAGSMSPGLDIYLYTHSMGGAVGALYMCRYPEKVKKVLLSSPMVSPKTHGMPHCLVKCVIRREAARTSWDSKFRYSGEFREDADFTRSADNSYNRFRHNLDLRIAEKRYQGSASTNCWMYEALGVDRRILDRQALSAVTASVLLVAAQRDTVVQSHPQKKLARLLGDRCRYVCIKNAKHSIFVSGEDILGEYIDMVKNFFAE